MAKACQQCGLPFEVYDEERAFLEKIGFTFGNVTIHPPEPVFCPDCRVLRRTCHRNERNLSKVRSAKTKKPTISLYKEKPLWGKPYDVFEQEEWKSDAFDALKFGRAFNFSRPFFEQWAELHKDVPRMALITISNENSDYTTGTGYCKNCYLINSSENCEDCYYGKLLQTCRSCIDCSYLYDSELCYECFSISDSYNCQYLTFSQNCSDCFFSSNLRGCKNCILCTNLSQKEYYVRNQEVSREEYEKVAASFRGSHAAFESMRQELMDLRGRSIQRYANIVNSENCTGDYIENSRKCLDCYDVTDSEDCRYVQVGVRVKDNYDCSNMYLKPELCYETLGTIEVYHCAYSLFVFHSQNLIYCEYCFNSRNSFACNGLQRKEYCVFNKQYTKDEYDELVPKIIDHMQRDGSWGTYFSPKYAPFGYNETLAYEYVPLPKEEALKRGFLWRDDVGEVPQVEKVIRALDLPDAIDDIPDDVLNWAISCERSSRPFQLTKQELAYYRQHRIPIPRLHPDERHRRRMELRNPRHLFDRTCKKCGKGMQSTYAPERPEIVYCEACYLEAVY